jgi:hypothetical protein
MNSTGTSFRWGKRDRLQGKFRENMSESVHAARQRAGRARRPTQGTLHFVHRCENVTLLSFDLLLSHSRLAGKPSILPHRCEPTVGPVGIRSWFPKSARNDHFFSFPSPTFESASFLRIHPANYFFSDHSSDDAQKKKECHHSIRVIGFSMKKRSCLSVLIPKHRADLRCSTF